MVKVNHILISRTCYDMKELVRFLVHLPSPTFVKGVSCGLLLDYLHGCPSELLIMSWDEVIRLPGVHIAPCGSVLIVDYTSNLAVGSHLNCGGTSKYNTYYFVSTSYTLNYFLVSGLSYTMACGHTNTLKLLSEQLFWAYR